MPISTLENKPLVTVICLCYNHEAYVAASLDSVRNQTYDNIEMIIVNDFSTDDSSKKIKEWLSENADNHIKFIDNSSNLGHTKSFNQAYALATGKYIIDLATDDILTPDAVQNHIHNFKKNCEAKISYSNIEYISPNGTSAGFFYKVNDTSTYKFDFTPKSGNLYKELLASFYLSACGMCVATEVYDELEGYDESLDYEDFDFWVRSSFKYHYVYSDFVSLQKRILETSHSSLAETQLKNRYRKDKSTFKVCKKAYYQNFELPHYQALKQRLIHEVKLVIKSKNSRLSVAYLWLLLKNQFQILYFQLVKS